MKTSIRNKLPGTITDIASDKVVSEVTVSTAAGEVTSIITTGSVKRMKLKKGDAVFVLVKATEVSLAKDEVMQTLATTPQRVKRRTE